MNHIPNIITVGDKILMGTLVAIAILSIAVSPAEKPRGAVAVIESENRLQRLDLSQEQVVSVPGPLGETLVEVRGRRVRIMQSPCPHHLCVRTGFRERSGDVIACIPNRVVVTIVKGTANADIDGLSR